MDIRCPDIVEIVFIDKEIFEEETGRVPESQDGLMSIGRSRKYVDNDTKLA